MTTTSDSLVVAHPVLSESSGSSSRTTTEPAFEEDRRHCRGCASTALRVDWAAGDRVCTNCGLVDEDRLLEERPEWRDFDDDNDLVRNAFRGGSSLGRCGLIPNNEGRWIGGLPPTSLSKYTFGRGGASAQQTRKQLIKTSQRIERQMEKRHERDLKTAKLSMQIRKRKRQSARMDDHIQETDQDMVDDDDHDVSVRPELERLLVQEEETALAATATLYAEKWSLQRAIRMFGNGHEVAALEEDGPRMHHDDDEEEGQKKLDATLTNASRDLYEAYSMLLQTAKGLQVPDRVTNEASATLVQYASRRDGLTVRGVSSQFKPQSRKNVQEEKSRALYDQEEREAKALLRQINKLKQMGSLVAAILFYTCRTMNVPRSLVQVCASVETPAVVNEFRLNRVGGKEGAFIKKKHCSKAMNEIRQVLPDIARTIPVATDTNGVLVSSSTSRNGDNLQSTESCVEHMARKLRLPPVAEASVRVLVAHCQEHLGGSSAVEAVLNTQKRFVLCAAVSYFICQMGEIMQNLAKQASASKGARPAIVPRKQRKLEKGSSSSSLESDKTASTQQVDMFNDDDEAKVAAMEHKAYEMRRVWDAWKEQTQWHRNPTEIERVANVSQSSMQEYFKTLLFPNRKSLLEALAQKAKLRSTTEEANATHGDYHLYQVPLASVLLPLVTIAEPLMKETVRQKDFDSATRTTP